MRLDSLIASVAHELGLRIVQRLGGGELGAALVHDASGRELVLKALPGDQWQPRFALGAELAGRLRSRGYPASEYIDTGVAAGASWSLQQRLPGLVPEVLSPARAHRLCALAAMHEGAAGRRGPPPPLDTERWLARVESQPDTAPLAEELRAVLARTDGIELLDDGIVHADFHHRNYLAIGDDITGVFDWDLAYVGD
jgi:hypothetical protein